jgi:hypothetical protein
MPAIRLLAPLVLLAAFASAAAASPPLQRGVAADFAGVWRSAQPNDLGTEIRTEGATMGIVIRFTRANATCTQGAAGLVDPATRIARIEARRTTCSDGFVQDGGMACTMRLQGRNRLVVSCPHNGFTNQLRRVR